MKIERTQQRPPHLEHSSSSRSHSRSRRVLVILALAAALLLPAGTTAAQSDQSKRKEQSSSLATAETVAAPAIPPFMAGRSADSDPTADSKRPSTSRAFVIEAPARAALQALWAASIRANEERAGCITGHMSGGAFHLTRADAVPTEEADSLRISPNPSLERCGPPHWSGTVHTHIATFNGQPFATLSPSDRAVMNVWRMRWKQEGVFCVLYSESEAYCEYATTLNGDTEYSAEDSEGEGVSVGR